jgi:hypothetical protein
MRRRAPRYLGTAALFLMLLFAITPQGLSAKGLINSRHFAVLQRGHGWQFIASRHHSERCTKLITGGGGSSSCSSLHSNADLQSFGVFSLGRHRRTWLHVETSKRVARLQIALLHAPDRNVDPKLIGERRAHKARLPNNFRFWTAAFPHCVSLKSVVAYGDDGSALDQFPPAGVPPGVISDDCKPSTQAPVPGVSSGR